MDHHPEIGAVGRTLSALNPHGQAEFDGVSFPVRGPGGLIDIGRPVVVTGFDPWLLFVREVVSEKVPTAPAPGPVVVADHAIQDRPGHQPAALPSLQAPDVPSLETRPIVEIIAPVQVSLRIKRANQPAQSSMVMIALTPDAIWIQDTWQTRSILLHSLGLEWRPRDSELVLSVGPETSAEELTLIFTRANVGEYWYREMQAQQQQFSPDVRQDVRYQPEGVALVQQVPLVSHVVLGPVEFTGQSAREAKRGVQLRAGMRGADAIGEVYHLKLPSQGPAAVSVSGVAIRVENADDRKQLRLTWFDEGVRALFNRLMLLLVLQAVGLFLTVAFCSSASSWQTPTGLTLSQTLASTGLWLGILCAWPLVLLLGMRILRWPQLLRGAGFAVLAATTGRTLTVWTAHLLAGGPFSILLDPLMWGFAVAGIVLCVRAWQLAGDARHILPPEAQKGTKARMAWAGGLLTVTVLYTLGLLGSIGFARYQASAYLMMPGVDPRREQQALLALNEGANQANRGELAAAEQTLQRALRLWEELAQSSSAPAGYRANLAMTLYNLGWIRLQQGRQDEAEKYYARVVALADRLGDDGTQDDQFKEYMASARETLAELRDGKSIKLLEEKDRTAERKYEEAQVKSQKGDLEAERMLQEAIELWEEVLPQATNEEYRKVTFIRLATAYLRLGTFQLDLGKLTEAEATLKRAIGHGEKAVSLEPDRPLPRHNLEVARQTLDGLREQVLQGEISKLIRDERYAAALERYLQGIEEQEVSIRSRMDRDAATRRLAYRLDRCAWFLAHCPDGRVRDTRAAIKHASRATLLLPESGEYWYTLALVQYRHGDWKESLETLDKLKNKEGAFDAMSWMLVAMNRHQFKQKKEARDAMRKAVEWIDDQQRKAEGNPLLRYQFELNRPSIESLKREAEKLIEGKDPGKQGVG